MSRAPAARPLAGSRRASPTAGALPLNGPCRATVVRGAGCRGQASLELVALLPLAVLVALAAAQVLAAGLARELAGHAAGAGAMAIAQGEDPSAAVRTAVPGWTRRGLRIEVDGRRVEVELRPPAVWHAVADLLAAHARADAGPAPASSSAGARP